MVRVVLRSAALSCSVVPFHLVLRSVVMVLNCVLCYVASCWTVLCCGLCLVCGALCALCCLFCAVSHGRFFWSCVFLCCFVSCCCTFGFGSVWSFVLCVVLCCVVLCCVVLCCVVLYCVV